MIDILTTPSMSKPMQDYSRTPGQVLSLISSFGFVSIQNNEFLKYCLQHNKYTILKFIKEKLSANTPIFLKQSRSHC